MVVINMGKVAIAGTNSGNEFRTKEFRYIRSALRNSLPIPFLSGEWFGRGAGSVSGG
jgi:hypothetical protein